MTSRAEKRWIANTLLIGLCMIDPEHAETEYWEVTSPVGCWVEKGLELLWVKMKLRAVLLLS